MELVDCAFPLLADMVLTDDPESRLSGHKLGLAGRCAPAQQGYGAQGPAVGQWRHLHRAGQGDQRQRRLRRARAGRRQPCQHQLPDRHAQRTRCAGRSLHRHDPARPQPRAVPTGRQGAASPLRPVKKVTIWGNHSATQYPDAYHAEINGQTSRRRDRRRRLDQGNLYPDRAEARRGDHRGARPEQRRQRRQRRHQPRADVAQRHGRRRLGEHGHSQHRRLWFARGCHFQLSGHGARTATYRSSRGCNSATSTSR